MGLFVDLKTPTAHQNKLKLVENKSGWMVKKKESGVRINKETSKLFETKEVVRQGDPLFLVLVSVRKRCYRDDDQQGWTVSRDTTANIV